MLLRPPDRVPDWVLGKIPIKSNPKIIIVPNKSQMAYLFRICLYKNNEYLCRIYSGTSLIFQACPSSALIINSQGGKNDGTGKNKEY
jgi:hypothetical protein